MKKEKKISLILILARKGSQRLKNKNIKIINKKPLIYWTINFAKKLNFKKKQIFVYSDSQKIINIAHKNSVFCPAIRPNYLSRSNTSSYKSAMHAINWYQKNVSKIDYIILLQPTSPFRSINTFKKMFSLFIKKKLDSLATFSIKNGKLSPNGNIYINKIKNLYKFKKFINKKTTKFITKSKREIIDIDEIDDFNIAKNYFKNDKILN